MTVSFETNAINCAVYFGATQYLLDLFGQGIFGRVVDGLAPERPGLVETFLIQIGVLYPRRIYPGFSLVRLRRRALETKNLQEKDAAWTSDSV
jgi:hypothetical protein